MKGIRFTRNRQNTRSFGKFLAEILHGRSRADSSFQMTSVMGIPFPDFGNVLFEIEIPFILLFLNRNKNSRIAPK